MQKLTIAQAVGATSYPGRGILAGKTPDGTRLFLAYFIMGRSVNSRNRVFVEDGEGLRTRAFDPSKLSDPSLIIYAPVRVLGNKIIVTNGDQTDTVYAALQNGGTFRLGAEDAHLRAGRAQLHPPHQRHGHAGKRRFFAGDERFEGRGRGGQSGAQVLLRLRRRGG